MTTADTTIRILADAIYDDRFLYGLDLSAQTLARARRDGTLRYTRKGKRILYLGEWILAWLKNETVATGEISHAR
jgi:hypothetical protein